MSLLINLILVVVAATLNGFLILKAERNADELRNRQQLQFEKHNLQFEVDELEHKHKSLILELRQLQLKYKN